MKNHYFLAKILRSCCRTALSSKKNKKIFEWEWLRHIYNIFGGWGYLRRCAHFKKEHEKGMDQSPPL